MPNMMTQHFKVCPDCLESTSDLGAMFCQRCGHRFKTTASNARPPAQTVPIYPPPVIGQICAVRPRTDGLAVASMVVGILSIVTICLWPISLMLSILGVSFGASSTRSKHHGLAIAGLVCSLISLVFCLIPILILAVGIMSPRAG